MPDHRRPVLVIALTLLVGLAGPTLPGSADPGGTRPPGVPPPVNPAALPTPAEVEDMPYRVNNTATQQIGDIEQRASCVLQTSGGRLTTEDDEPFAQRRLRVQQAHGFATGEGQLVAVIDSGVNQHVLLTGRLHDGGDYLEDNTGLFDCDGHGTAVAGLIASAPDPNTGFVGIAPDADILSIRQGSSFHSVPLREVTSDEQFRNDVAGDTVSMARAVVRAVNMGATVINISEAACFTAKPDQVNAQDLQAAVSYALDQDVVVVVAAANVGGQCEQNEPGEVTTISSPGWYDSTVLTVAATDMNDEPTDFSMRGPWVDVAAPGVDALSLDPDGTSVTDTLVDVHGNRMPISGTSFATAYVAGLAALIRERYPDLTAEQVMHRIQQTTQGNAGLAGRSEAIGYGIVDPITALTAVLPEEHDALGSGLPTPGAATDLQLPQAADPITRNVALIGSGAALGLLGLTLLVVYTISWHRQQRTSRPG